MSTHLGILTNPEVLSQEEVLVFPVPNLCLMVFLLLCLISAFSLLYVKDLSRRMFIEYHKLQTVATKLSADQEKLLLEQSAWSTAMRVQNIAIQKLDMQVPLAKDIVMVKIL